MAKLCVNLGEGVIKKLDLDGGGSVPSTGYDNDFSYVESDTVSNTSSTLMLVMVYCRNNWYELTVVADITNNGRKLLTGLPVYAPGTDGSDRYPAGVPITFLLMKGDVLKFRSGDTTPFTPAKVVTRVIIP
jgi:hypothetical protein